MTRLAFKLDNSSQDDALRTAASRIGRVTIVDLDDAPDAVVTNMGDGAYEAMPTLYLGETPVEDPLLFPAFPWRFRPDVAVIRQSLDQGQLGQPGLIRAHLWAPASRPLGRQARIGAVDVVLWLFGRPPEAVYRVTHPTGSTLIHLGFEGGGMALLDFTDTLEHGEGYQSFGLIGSQGAAYADDHPNRNLLFTGGAPGASPPGFGGTNLQALLEDFVQGLGEQRRAATAYKNYQQALAVLEQSTQS